MTKKTTRRRGQVIAKGNGKFKVMIYLGTDPNGRNKYFTKTIVGSKKNADDFLIKKLHEIKEGEFIEPALMPLNSYLARWLEDVARIKVRRVTYEGYRAKISRYVENGIGKKRLCDLQAYDIQRLYNEMINRDLSAKTVRHVHNVLNPALKQAIKWKLIKHNPCELCTLPKLVRREMKYFTQNEVNTFLEFAKEDRYYAAFVLAIETGMRPEEYLGLKWADIDLENRHLSVRRALVPLKGGGFEFTEPKTPKSRRNIPLSRSMVSILKTHRHKQIEAKMAIRDVYEDHDLVFPTVIGTPTLTGNLDRRHFKKIIEKANDAIQKRNVEHGSNDLPIKVIRLYDLRHTMATMLLLAGFNPKIVSERLGHSSVSLTLDTYSHVLPTMQDGATGQMESLMFGT